ncbi:MAG TPA: hypothetical protein VGH23_20245 [Rhizomicrobium sp.]|jgi:hypothetical protein
MMCDPGEFQNPCAAYHVGRMAAGHGRAAGFAQVGQGASRAGHQKQAARRFDDDIFAPSLLHRGIADEISENGIFRHAGVANPRLG